MWKFLLVSSLISFDFIATIPAIQILSQNNKHKRVALNTFYSTFPIPSFYKLLLSSLQIISEIVLTRSEEREVLRSIPESHSWVLVHHGFAHFHPQNDNSISFHDTWWRISCPHDLNTFKGHPSLIHVVAPKISGFSQSHFRMLYSSSAASSDGGHIVFGDYRFLFGFKYCVQSVSLKFIRWWYESFPVVF